MKFEIITGHTPYDAVKCPRCEMLNVNISPGEPHTCMRCSVVTLNGKEISDSWEVRKTHKLKLFRSMVHDRKTGRIIDVYILAKDVEEADDKAVKRYGGCLETKTVYNGREEVAGEFIF